MELGGALSKYQQIVLLTVMMFKLGTPFTAENCMSSPCRNGGTCQVSVDDITCVCPREPVWYVGEDCGQLYDACIDAPCANCTSALGTDQFTCQCPHGYGGRDCQERVTNCSGQPCRNDATCVITPGGYECRCAPGYEGSDCEEDIDECRSAPCHNGAICKDGVNLYQCFCVPGFQGYHCDLDINECSSRPCENNATCIDQVDRYRCVCALGFKGVNCEAEIDECEEQQPCKNGATCHDHVGRYSCQCVAGFQGHDCQVDVDECASAPCLNEGSCVDRVNSYECDCRGTGFIGEHCEEDIPECASDPCQNGATCLEGVNQYNCLCWPGYEGENCQVDIDECELEPCENGGECFQRSDMMLYGVLPELVMVFSYDEAAGYLCHCPPGFTGESCSLNVDECESGPCQNGGTCEDLVNAYQCVCPPGFTGGHCEVDIDDCESEPCQNGASCEDGVNDYTCRCVGAEPGGEPWGGRDCDVQLIGCREHRCEQGATCVPVLTGDRHGQTCLCPPGFAGELCNTTTTFSFSTEGYIFIQLSGGNRTRRDVADHLPRHQRPWSHELHVQLRFRTTLPDMLLFYRGDDDRFVSLEIVGGLLQARGVISGNVLKVAHPHPVTDGNWNEAVVTLDGKLAMAVKGAGCGGDAGCTVEDKGRDRRTLLLRGEFPNVYVGGVPEDYLNNTGSRKGFIGCMEDLQVDHELVLPQDLSPDKAGDMELGCNKTEWCQSHACSQHGSCVDLWTSFRCDCHRPFYNDSCEEEYISSTFGHEDADSYASYNIDQSHGQNFNISFFLRSLKPSGVLFQLTRQQRAYFTLYLREGAMAFNSPPTTLLLPEPRILTTGQKELVTVVVRQGHVVFPQAGTQRYLGSVSVEAGDVAYVGGLPTGENNASYWGGNFKGCLQDVRLDHMHLEPKEGYHNKDKEYALRTAQNVSDGCVSDNACKGGPCLNGGECTVTWNDFQCGCPLNFSGRTCDTHIWCVSDPCVMGSQCLDLPDGYECLTNATFEDNALQYRANGSLVVAVTSVSMQLRTREEDGILLRATSGPEVFCLGLLNSSLLVKLYSGNSLELVAFTSELPISDGAWHHLHLAMADPLHAASRWHLTVDGQRAGSSWVAGGNLNFLNHSTVWLAENFTGCLGEVRVGDVYLPLADHQEAPPQSSRFVRQGGRVPDAGCTGAPVCEPQPCLNGGACQDLFNLFNCSCAPGWEGQSCQTDVDECASGPCGHGTCTDLLADYRCECHPGYRGQSCQEELDMCLEQSCRNGGSCLNTTGSFSCTCPPEYSGPLCQWRFPPERCDVDVQCINGGFCTNLKWGANCTCKPGFIGDRCEAEIDECESGPCLHGASCVDSLDSFQCVCAPGFSGTLCSNKLALQREIIPWVVIAIPLASLCVLLAIMALLFMVLTARKKRQSEGTYSPSSQEVAGARLEMGSVLKVPPEERLI